MNIKYVNSHAANMGNIHLTLNGRTHQGFQNTSDQSAPQSHKLKQN